MSIQLTAAVSTSCCPSSRFRRCRSHGAGSGPGDSWRGRSAAKRPAGLAGQLVGGGQLDGAGTSSPQPTARGCRCRLRAPAQHQHADSVDFHFCQLSISFYPSCNAVSATTVTSALSRLLFLCPLLNDCHPRSSVTSFACTAENGQQKRMRRSICCTPQSAS